MMAFEKIYNRVSKNRMPVFLGNKPLIISIGLPILSIATMVLTHTTMVHFRIMQSLGCRQVKALLPACNKNYG
ncbi:hypothetical protein NQ317_008544 [Molorchus minor]|uniref:Uncharacterized protein n=1 Tax=Molorchus minor TaxID=1323400 RepID=A0ABQ9J2G5_9CUCU|nr:hypothetical protein NQ317_008544 [Molorchus minor]